MNKRLRHLLALGALLLCPLALPAAAVEAEAAPLSAATIQAPGDPLLTELRRHGSRRGTPVGTLPQGYEVASRGSASPTRAQRTIGIRVDTDKPVVTASGNWYGFPNQLVPQVGRIWIIGTDGSWIPMCSGTVVSRGLVLTAGHCIAADNGEYYSRILFVPGQTWNVATSNNPADIKAPWGVWEAWDWWAPDSYRDGSGGPDWGIIQIKPQNGRQIGDVVGSWPIRTGIQFNRGAQVWSTGYPGNGFWSTVAGRKGRGQYACSSRWNGDWSYGNTTQDVVIEIDCPMNGGASGGPWLVRLSTGAWVIGGVNNWCFDDDESDDVDTYCTPTSSQLQMLLLDGRFINFWNSVLRLVH